MDILIFIFIFSFFEDFSSSSAKKKLWGLARKLWGGSGQQALGGSSEKEALGRNLWEI